MTTEHYLGPIPYETLPAYRDADILEVYKRLAERHKEYTSEEQE